MAGSGTIPPFGHGAGSPFGDEAGALRLAGLEARRRRQSGNRPPKRPRGPRFALLRRIVRAIRGEGD